MAGTPALSDAPHDLGDGSRPELHRSIGPFQMALYGLGSMLGSGVYGLIGQATVLPLLLVFAFLNGAPVLLKNREGAARAFRDPADPATSRQPRLRGSRDCPGDNRRLACTSPRRGAACRDFRALCAVSAEN
jgi:hypothetical protein